MTSLNRRHLLAAGAAALAFTQQGGYEPMVEDAIHVAGGGPVMGGGLQSAVHEAFTLS